MYEMDLTPVTIYSVLVLLVFAGSVSSQTYENATNLRTMLLSDYHKDIRPLNNQSHAVHVNLSMVLYGIPEIDGVKGAIKITVGTLAEWMDERISWNPSDYGGISKIPILMNEVWNPLISLATPIEFATMSSPHFHVTFYSDGLAVFFPGAVLESSCSFNMKFWPFDKQVCEVVFFPMDYGPEHVLLSIPSNGVNTNFYTPNAEWTLDDTSYFAGEKSGFSMAYFNLKLKRQSVFYVLTIILPINGIIGLTCLVFLLPSESGERVSYAITIMLSLAVFLTVVSAEIPKTSEPIALICCYILAGIAVSIFGTVAAILNLDIFHRNEDIPKRQWYISLTRLSNCRRNNRVQDEPQEINDPKNSKQTHLSAQFPVKRNRRKTNLISVKLSAFDQANEDAITWKDVSNAIDKLLLYTLFIFAYIPSICFLIYLAAATDYQ